MFDPVKTTKITRDLMIVMGFEIDPYTNKIFDQETKSTISSDGKFIKVNVDPNKALQISEYDVKLDPLDPKCTKIMEFIFGKFLQDNEECGNLPHSLSYFFDKEEKEDESDKSSSKYRLNVIFEDSNMRKWVGNWYYNKIICFDEAIFSLDGTFIETDLRPYDIEQMEWNE